VKTFSEEKPDSFKEKKQLLRMLSRVWASPIESEITDRLKTKTN